MICLLIRTDLGKEEIYWKVGQPPTINAERVIGIQANEEELLLIYKTASSKSSLSSIESWFGIEAKKISILIGAAR